MQTRLSGRATELTKLLYFVPILAADLSLPFATTALEAHFLIPYAVNRKATLRNSSASALLRSHNRIQIDSALSTRSNHLAILGLRLHDLQVLPVAQRAVIRLVLHVRTVVNQATVDAHRLVISAVVLGKAPLLRHEDLLSARELSLRATQSLDHLQKMQKLLDGLG